MNRIVTYLESKEVVFHGALLLIVLYVPHAGHLFKQLEHLDMTFYGYSFLNWVYAIALAAIIELLILIFIINGYQKTGKAYALLSFFINALYYDYWFMAISDPSISNFKMMGASFLICLMHSVSIWQLSELFFKRVRATVIRDYDRDAILDFDNGSKETGNFGINIHRAESTGATQFIDQYSAGCQVFKDADDFYAFMQLCKLHAKHHGNSFSYTLVDFRSLRRITLKRVITATTVFAALALGWIFTPKVYEHT